MSSHQRTMRANQKKTSNTAVVNHFNLALINFVGLISGIFRTLNHTGYCNLSLVRLHLICKIKDSICNVFRM